MMTKGDVGDVPLTITDKGRRGGPYPLNMANIIAEQSLTETPHMS